MKLAYTILKSDNFTNINELLKVKFKISTNLLSKLIRTKNIKVNNEICDTRKMYPDGSLLEICFDYEEESDNIVATKMNLDIVYEDEWLLVLNKPSGIPIHPSMLHFSDSLSSGVKFYFDSIALKKKIRPVNRLDLYTSGLVIFAKCEYIQEALIRQMQSHLFKKCYLAISCGVFERKDNIINKPIARKPGSIIERCIDFENGKPSITHYRVLKTSNDKNCSLILCTLKTGRTHQIRVHLNSIGHPLLGDSLYGMPHNDFDGQALHCYKLSFLHPVSKKFIKLKSFPDWFSKIE